MFNYFINKCICFNYVVFQPTQQSHTTDLRHNFISQNSTNHSHITYSIPQSAHTVSTEKLLRMDRCGPKHVQLTPKY